MADVSRDHSAETAIPPEVQQRINVLESLVSQLKTQLETIRKEKGGGTGGEEDTPGFFPLEKVEEEFKAACQRLVATIGDQDESDSGAQIEAQVEFDKWERRLAEHPDKIAADLEAERSWMAAQEPVNAAALLILQSFVPPVSDLSLSKLSEALPEALAERVWAKKSLWLARMPRDAISRLHIADLSTRFAPHKLDLLELRGVFAALPETFDNDKGGEKLAWREIIKDKLRKAIKDEEAGKLSPADCRNEAYFLRNDTIPDSSDTGSIQICMSPVYRGVFDPEMELDVGEHLAILDAITKKTAIAHQDALKAAEESKALRAKRSGLSRPSSKKSMENAAFASQLSSLLGGGGGGGGSGRGRVRGGGIRGRGGKGIGRGKARGGLQNLGSSPKNNPCKDEEHAVSSSRSSNQGLNEKVAKGETCVEDHASSTKPKLSDMVRKFESGSKRSITKSQEERMHDLQSIRRKSSLVEPKAKEAFRQSLNNALKRASNDRFANQPLRKPSAVPFPSHTGNKNQSMMSSMMMVQSMPSMAESWVQISENEKNEADKIEQLVSILQAQIADLQGSGAKAVQSNLPSSKATKNSASTRKPAPKSPPAHPAPAGGTSAEHYSFVEKPGSRQEKTAVHSLYSLMDNPPSQKVATFVSNISENLRSLMLEQEYRDLAGDQVHNEAHSTYLEEDEDGWVVA